VQEAELGAEEALWLRRRDDEGEDLDRVGDRAVGVVNLVLLQTGIRQTRGKT
jgi:hypothetical protein